MVTEIVYSSQGNRATWLDFLLVKTLKMKKKLFTVKMTKAYLGGFTFSQIFGYDPSIKQKAGAPL